MTKTLDDLSKVELADEIVKRDAEIERWHKAGEELHTQLAEKNAEIERLRAVVDAAAWYVNSLENGKTAEAMNLRLQALAKALAALEDV